MALILQASCGAEVRVESQSASAPPATVIPLDRIRFVDLSDGRASRSRPAATTTSTSSTTVRAVPTTVAPHPVARRSLPTTTTTSTVPAAPAVVDLPDPGADPRQIGQVLAAARGWDGQQWTCLERLWAEESGWSTTAANRSGAYGIPQALPGSKIATAATPEDRAAGRSWRTDAAMQIRWGLAYIAGRPDERTPCGALAHKHARGWY